MDRISKIRWEPGMELTSGLLRMISETNEQKLSMFLKAVFNRACLFPGVTCSISACFVKKHVEIDISGLVAVLPSGSVIAIDDKVSVPVKSLPEGSNYVCASLGGKQAFEREGVPCVRDEVVYSILTLEEASSRDVFPILKMQVADGSVEIVQDYILPCSTLCSDNGYGQWCQNLIELSGKLAEHPNLESAEARRMFLLLRDTLSALGPQSKVDELLFVAKILFSTVSFYIKTEDVQPVPSSINPLDITGYRDCSMSLLNDSVAVLDKTVLVDNSIDYDAMKMEIQQAVQDKLKEELLGELDLRMIDLSASFANRLSEKLKEYISGEFKSMLHDSLHTEISEELQGQLYTSLYDALYKALYVPVAEREAFMPII